jgi:hypothetical protein
VRCELGWVYEEGEDGQGVRSERVPDWTGTIVPSDQLRFFTKGRRLREEEGAYRDQGDLRARLPLWVRHRQTCPP